MKKVRTIGITLASPGDTGEKYVIWAKGLKRFIVLVPLHGRKGPKGGTPSKKMGHFKDITEAIECRDKYVTEFL